MCLKLKDKFCCRIGSFFKKTEAPLTFSLLHFYLHLYNSIEKKKEKLLWPQYNEINFDRNE